MNTRLHCRYWLWPALLTLSSVGCGPTFAPPVRGITYGAPGRLPEGRMEVSGAALVPWAVGGPQLAFGIRDWVAMEGGATMLLVGQRQSFVMANVGPRFTLAPNHNAPVRFAADLELGVGAGLGGVLRGNPVSDSLGPLPDWSDRVAFGAYQGLGLGLHVHWFALYLRGRLEESKATGVPQTTWASGTLGMDFDIKRRLAIGLGGGWAAYWNEIDRQSGPVVQVSLTVFFDVADRQDREPE